jgi:hypothetical protein
MTLILQRRSFLIGATAALIVAPAIVRASSLMPVREPLPMELVAGDWTISHGRKLLLPRRPEEGAVLRVHNFGEELRIGGFSLFGSRLGGFKVQPDAQFFAVFNGASWIEQRTFE